MTANDNFRHYIGDLEASDDIDVVFKHIYDLMLANGGEGTGFNADMVDGYHASDFAPVSLVDEVDKTIRTISFGGRTYDGANIDLEILASQIPFKETDDSEAIPVETYLRGINNRVSNSETDIEDINSKISFLTPTEEDAPNIAEALTYIAENNLKADPNNPNKSYLNSDSVNGLSLQVLTQAQYDDLDKALKQDPRNIFIINNDVESDFNPDVQYVPPSVLQAGLNLEFRINTDTHNVEYSVDGREENDEQKVWQVVSPLVLKSNKKGFLYPEWFSEVRDVINNNSDLQEQDDYPFILNTTYNKTLLEDIPTQLDNKLENIQIGNSQATVNNQIANITDNLNTYLSTYLTNYVNESADLSSRIQNQINSAFNTNQSIEKVTNKATNIPNNKSNTYYPTTQAVYDYVSPIQASVPQYSWTSVKANGICKSTGTIYFYKYGRVVNVTASLNIDGPWVVQGLDNYGEFMNIPAGYEPAGNQRIVAQSSYMHKCLVLLQQNNGVWAGLVGRFDMNGKTSYTVPDNYWVTFSHTYISKS